MPTESLEFLRGTLDLLILRALKIESTHGYGVLKWIERATGDQLRIEEGSLYPALYRVQKRGWITSEWGLSENNWRARFYWLTISGCTQLVTEAADFERFARVVLQALDIHPTPA
jgi:transcriptional regulator